MSKLLHNAFEANSVWVTPRVAGEVQLNFVDKSLVPIIIRAGSEMELTSKVNVMQLRKSNLRDLITRRILRLVVK